VTARDRHLAATVALLAVSAIACALPSAASAALAFPDQRPVTVGWDELSDGTAIRLCNAGRRAVDLRPTLAGFRFRRAGRAVADDTVLGAGLPNAGRLAAGDCADITLSADGREPDRGSYTGVVAVSGGGGGIARKEVTVSVPVAAGGGGAVAGAQDPVPLTARKGPFGSASLTGDKALMLEAGGAAATIGAACDGSDETACPALGNLYDGDEIAQVRVAGPAHTERGVTLLPVTVSGADAVGDYSGRLDIPGSDGIAVALQVTAPWWWALFALLLGAALAVAAQLWTGRIRPMSRLRRRADALQGAYADGDRVVKSVTHGLVCGPTPERVAAYRDSVEQAVAAAGRSALDWDAGSDGGRAVEASLALAERDAAYLAAESGGLADALSELEAALDAVELDPAADALGSPRLLSGARALLSGRLNVGEAVARGRRAQEAVALLEGWRELAARARRYERWLASLRALGELPPAERRLLDFADATLFEVARELLDAADGAALERLGTAADLDRVYDALARVGGAHDSWLPADSQPGQERSLELFGGGLLRERLDGLGRDGDGAEAEVLARAARAAKLAQAGSRAADVAVVALAVFSGVLAGLVAFYFGKTWGSFSDFLTLVFAGTAATALAQGVLDQLAKVWDRGTGAAVLDLAQPAQVAIATVAAGRGPGRDEDDVGGDGGVAVGEGGAVVGGDATPGGDDGAEDDGREPEPVSS
jgi:hypothetical protein